MKEATTTLNKEQEKVLCIKNQAHEAVEYTHPFGIQAEIYIIFTVMPLQKKNRYFHNESILIHHWYRKIKERGIK